MVAIITYIETAKQPCWWFWKLLLAKEQYSQLTIELLWISNEADTHKTLHTGSGAFISTFPPPALGPMNKEEYRIMYYTQILKRKWACYQY